MVRRVSMTAFVASYVAALLAFASAGVTAYWLAGGTALLDTVGGALERLARSRSASVLAIALLVVMAKVAAGAFAVALTRRPSRRLGTLAAVAGALLAIYGAVLTVAGALVLTGAGSISPTDGTRPTLAHASLGSVVSGLGRRACGCRHLGRALTAGSLPAYKRPVASTARGRSARRGGDRPRRRPPSRMGSVSGTALSVLPLVERRPLASVPDRAASHDRLAPATTAVTP